jgi:hypothetical protein
MDWMTSVKDAEFFTMVQMIRNNLSVMVVLFRG